MIKTAFNKIHLLFVNLAEVEKHLVFHWDFGQILLTPNFSVQSEKIVFELVFCIDLVDP